MSQLHLPRSGGRRADVSRRRFLRNAAGVGIGIPLGASALAACSSDDDGGFADPGEPEDTPDPGNDGDIEQFTGTLTIATLNNPHDDAKRALEAAYQERQPNVQFVWETQDLGPEEYDTFLTTQLAAGDVRFDLVSGNYAPTFDGYVNLDQYQTAINQYTGNPWNEDLNWNFGIARNQQGERIRLASQSVFANWYYNADVFADLGLDVPATWDELVAVCEELAASGITPVSTAWSWQVPQWLGGIYFDAYHTHWVEHVRAQPDDYNYNPAQDDPFDANNPNLHSSYTYNLTRFLAGLRDGELRYDTDEVAELVSELKRVYPVHAPGDFFVNDDPYAPFIRRNTAMMVNGGWAIGSLLNDMEEMSDERLEELGLEAGQFETFEWSTFDHPPMTTPGVKTEWMRSVESASGEYISVVDQGGEQTRMALDFAMFWLSEPGHTPYIEAAAAVGDFTPAGGIQVAGVEMPSEFAAIFADLEVRGNGSANYTGYFVGPGGSDFQTDKLNLLQAALEDDITPEEYASQLQQYHEDNLDGILEFHERTHDDLDNPERQPEAL
jgi:raffinose/stachyose/melibiose transport system substrate-binding protein